MSLWNNDRIQFARLLSELNAADAILLDDEDVMHCVCDSMDLQAEDVNELLDRAEAVWEKSCAGEEIARLQKQEDLIKEAQEKFDHIHKGREGRWFDEPGEYEQLKQEWFDKYGQALLDAAQEKNHAS